MVYKDFFLAAKQGSTIVATILPQIIGSDGTLTDGVGGSLRGQFKRFKINARPTKDNISSVDSPRANNLLLEENFSVDIEEMQRTGLNSNVLPAMVANADVFKITLSYARKTYGPFFVTRNEFSDGIESKGNGTIMASFDLVDVGQTSTLPYAEV